MNIAVSLNKKYYRYTYVMLTSLYRNHPKSSISLYVLHNDLGSEEQNGLSNLTRKYENQIAFLPIRREDFPEALPVNEMWSLETYFRLKLPDILPVMVDRLLYLDVDIIVNRNLSALYDMDFEDKYFVVCKDLGVNGPFSDIRGELFNPLIEKGYQYFNAGVMLWNMTALRGKYAFHYYMQLAQKLDYRILAPDQDLLNYTHCDQVKYADEYKFNLWGRLAFNFDIHYEQVKKEAFILHYTGFKPWSGQYVHYDIEKLWWDYAKLTPFYHELLEEFTEAVLTVPLINDTIQQLSSEKNILLQELTKSQALCRQLSALL